MTDSEAQSDDYGIGRPFLDKLLLAIIDGHPTLDSTTTTDRLLEDRARRLETARNSLLGNTQNIGRPRKELGRALRWMAAERLKDNSIKAARNDDLPFYKGTAEWDYRSAATLAKLAVKEFNLDSRQHVSLRKQFKAQEHALLTTEYHYDDIPNAVEFTQIEEIAKILNRNGIPTALNDIEYP